MLSATPRERIQFGKGARCFKTNASLFNSRLDRKMPECGRELGAVSPSEALLMLFLSVCGAQRRLHGVWRHTDRTCLPPSFSSLLSLTFRPRPLCLLQKIHPPRPVPSSHFALTYLEFGSSGTQTLTTLLGNLAAALNTREDKQPSEPRGSTRRLPRGSSQGLDPETLPAAPTHPDS